MRRLSILLAALLMPFLVPAIAQVETAKPQGLQAQPVLKIINFTAEWCPNCQILNPAIQDALTQFPQGQIEVVNLDMTHAGRGTSEVQRLAVYADAIRLADSHQSAYLWDWYGGVTGLAAIVSADNGEPISCMNRVLDANAIAGRLREAQIISKRRAPGTRMPQGPDCPPPLR